MATGVVKMFNGNRGYGFINPDDDEPDVFRHASALEQAGIEACRSAQSYRLTL